MPNMKRLMNKVYSIVMLGGKCVDCGAYLMPSQYDLHHPDGRGPNTPRDLMSLSRERLNEELEDVILLCANCHRLVHDEFNTEELDIYRVDLDPDQLEFDFEQE